MSLNSTITFEPRPTRVTSTTTTILPETWVTKPTTSEKYRSTVSSNLTTVTTYSTLPIADLNAATVYLTTTAVPTTPTFDSANMIISLPNPSNNLITTTTESTTSTSDQTTTTTGLKMTATSTRSTKRTPSLSQTPFSDQEKLTGIDVSNFTTKSEPNSYTEIGSHLLITILESKRPTAGQGTTISTATNATSTRDQPSKNSATNSPPTATERLAISSVPVTMSAASNQNTTQVTLTV